MLARNSPRSESGFSVPELMIVVAVALIILAAGVPVVTTTLSEFNLILSAQQLAGQIQFARMRAVSSNEALCVRLSATTGAYQIELENGAIHTGPFTLPRGVTLNTTDGGDPVSFPGHEILFLPTGSLPVSGTGSAGRVKLIGRTGLRIDVVVDGGGMVRLTPTYKSPPAAF
jgi:prepilin-type N-terminal cleavage/methylation domain-containing protein